MKPWSGVVTLVLGLAASFVPTAASASTCGDLLIEGLEACDDGNTVPDDDCSYPSCLPRICGDSIVNPDPGTDEECDDGNTVDGDSCPADCARGEEMPRDQRQCVNEANEQLAAVARAQNRDDAHCLRRAARGLSAILDCLGQDLEGRVARSQQLAARRIAARCVPPAVPGFAFSDAATVSGAAPPAVLASVAMLLGDAPAIANRTLEEAEAACQAEVLKQYNALLEGWLSAANRAIERALKGADEPPPTSPQSLVARIETGIAEDQPLARLGGRAALRIERKCEGLALDPLFHCGGGSAAVEDMPSCALTWAFEAACKALEAADLLDLGCPSDF